MDPILVKSKTSEKKNTSCYGIKVTPKLHHNNSVPEVNVTAKRRTNGLIKPNGMYSTSACKVPDRQDCRSANQTLKSFGKNTDNTIKKGNSKSKIASYIKPNESNKKNFIKSQSVEQKRGYLIRSYLSSNFIARNNLYLSSNGSVFTDKYKREYKLRKLFPNRSFTKSHSQSDTELDYSSSYGDQNDISSKRKLLDAIPNNKKVKFEILPRRDLKLNSKTNFANTKEMKKDEGISKPLKPILKAEKFKSSEKLLIVPCTDEKHGNGTYQYTDNFGQIPNKGREILNQNCISEEENVPSESFNQSQNTCKSSKYIADNVNFHALSASNFKDETHPGNCYTKIKMSEFDTKIKHLQQNIRETFEKEINDKVEFLKGTFLKEIEGIKKDISCTEENKENPTNNCDNTFKELTFNFEGSEISDLKSESDNNIFSNTFVAVNHTSDNTQLNYFNKNFGVPDNTGSTSSAASQMPPSNFQAEKYLESFVSSEERSFREKTKSLEKKLVECNGQSNEVKGGGTGITDVFLKGGMSTLRQELCSSQSENSKVNEWLDDAHFPTPLWNCKVNDSSNMQNESTICNRDTLKATTEFDEQLSKSPDLQSRIIHASTTPSNEDYWQEIREIAKEIVKSKDENRARVQNRIRGVLVIFLIMFFGMLIYVLIHA